MNGVLKSKIVKSVLVLIAITAGSIFASDVVVQNGYMTVGNGMDVEGESYFNNAYVDNYLIDYGDAYINGELEAGYYPILRVPSSYYEPVEISYTDLYVPDGSIVTENITCSNILIYETLTTWTACDAYIIDLYAGKITSTGGYDPPYVLYDQQSRDEIIDRVSKEVFKEKLGGAALFFNKDTKKLESYVATEGKFYDMQGNVVYQLSEPAKTDVKYEPFYLFNSSTGQTIELQKPAVEKYSVKQGYRLDNKTGNFINTQTYGTATREEALELYSESEGKYYDLNHNFIREEKKVEPVKYYKDQYYFDSSTGEVAKRQIALKDAYVIKDGYKLNKETGEFIDVKTKDVVPKDKAVELRKYTLKPTETTETVKAN
jgi:hypothetical protein